MPRSRADLVIEVLDLLGVTNVGQEPSAEDAEKVDQMIDGKFAELGRRQIFYVQDPLIIDDEFFQPLAKIVANAVAPKFGQPYDAAADAREEQRLRDIDRRPPSYAIMAGSYF